MMCFKTSFEMLLACAITSICIIDIDVANGINVHMNENITAVAGEGGIEINCSYTKENVKTVFTVGLFARNQTNDFVSIATFLPDDATEVTPSGEYLRDRITMTNITQESTEATLIFNEIKCTDQNQYRCKVTYLNTNNDADSKMSPPTTINVTVKPLKPHIFSKTSQQNHNINKKSILPSGVINRSSIYQTTSETDHDMSSVTTARIILENEQFPREGDNLTFVCSGNVGRPPGHIMWQIVYMHENTLFKYVNGTTQSEPFHLKCSLNRTSYLTIQLSANDFNARIRCFVVSHDGNDRLYDDTEPLNFHFGVSHVSINTLPDKQIFDTTIKNITLTCEADGNPKPTYAWYKRNDTNNILSKSNKYVIHNVIKNNSGTYICEVYNFISEEKYNVSTSVEIIIENKNDQSEHKNSNSEIYKISWIGIGIGVCFTLAIAIYFLYKCRAERKKCQSTSMPFSENAAKDNPGYSSVSETNIDRDKRDSGNVKNALNCTLGNKEKRKVKSSITAISKYQKEDTDNMLKYQNTCNNSPDHYASSEPGIYDALHDKRHKTENGEKLDKMSELNIPHEKRNQSIERNKSIEQQDSTMINCHASPLEKSKPGGYESVVIEGDVHVLSSVGNGYVHGDIEIVRQHNKEYLQHQKEETEEVNKLPISNQPVEYAQINETTKLKNKKKHNDTDQATVDTSAEIHEGIKVESEERHGQIDENDDHLDKTRIISKENSDEETESLFKASHSICNINPTFENDGVSGKDEKVKVAMVSPTIRLAGCSDEHKQNETTNAETKDRVNLIQKVDDDDDDEYCNTTKNVKSLPSSEDNTQTKNKNAEIEQGVNDRSTRMVDNLGYFDTTTYLRKQQTNGNPESSIKNDQIGSYINPAFDREENQKVDAVSSPFRSTDGLQDDGERDPDSGKQSKNGYENVGNINQTEL